MAQQQETQIEETESIISSVFFIKIMSKRRTWVFLFISVYAILLSISWNFLKSVLSWYESTISANSSISSSGWPVLYASVLLGVAFGVLSMVAALAVVLPATLVTWITILVLLTFAGKPRRDLVLEGKKLTLDITGFVIKILIKEGNVVAALCAVLAYFVLLISRNKQLQNGVDDH
ncbi:uncharacterized protein LOC125878032 [Solanum stenotomum]|uniref:uncharacterized protein LOC125878032 n=1 Tax=Solanum stenotomum TaxID=172797 RepID=UPI0020D0F6C8|nr:uncharacterized protein LOC125878032 [Solanum stenotomum]